MDIYSIKNEGFFDTFDGDFRNKLFHSKVREFDLTVRNTCLSIKVPFNFEEYYIIENQQYIIPGGHYRVFNSKEEVQCKTQRFPEPAEAVSIYLDTDLVKEVNEVLQSCQPSLEPIIYEEHLMPIFFEKTVPLKADILGKFLALLQGIDTNMPKSKLFAYSIAERLILVQQPHLRGISSIAAKKLSTRMEIYRRLDLARDFIHDEVEANFQIANLAQLCCMSEYNFIRQFKAVFQVSPYQYVLQQKIERAKKLLSNEKLSVGDTARRLGFADSSSFGKFFRKWTGQMPSEYFH